MTITKQDPRTTAMARPAPEAPKEVAHVENMTQRTAPSAQWMAASERALVLTCATRIADLRTADVRSIARVDIPRVDAVPTAALKRDRGVFAGTPRTTGMGHVGFAGYVPGSLAWSPPI